MLNFGENIVIVYVDVRFKEEGRDVEEENYKIWLFIRL